MQISNDRTNVQIFEPSLQAFARETSPEQRQHVLEALEAIQNDSLPLEGVSKRWTDILQQIYRMEPEQRSETARRTLEIVARAFAEPSTHRSGHEKAPSVVGDFDVLNPHLFHCIIDCLPPQSRAQFARTCQTSRELVRSYRVLELNRYLNFPGLEPLLLRFCQHVPDIRRPESLDPWLHELQNEVIPTLLENLLLSSIPTEDEKEEFRAHSVMQIASDPQRLYRLFISSYQLNLAILALRGEWYDSVAIAPITMQQIILERPSLREKAESVATYLQLHPDTLYTIAYNGPSGEPGERLTCLPHEILSLRVINLFLNGHSIRVLPREICCLGGDLQKLSLKNNPIVVLPKSFFMLSNLKRIYVDKHLVDQIPEQIRTLPDLFINGKLANPPWNGVICHKLSGLADELTVIAKELWIIAKNL